MARVWLADYECVADRPGDELPAVCMVCGEEATGTVGRNFRWHPPWMYVFLLLGLLPGFVLLHALSTTMRAFLPVCRRHRGHWLTGELAAGVPVVLGLAGLIGCLAVPSAVAGPGNRVPPAWVGWAVAAGFALLIAGLAAAAVLSSRLVRPLEITPDDIHLANVSDEFVAAVRAKRRAGRDRTERD